MRKTVKHIYKIRLQKGDTVVVRTGKDKGKTGTVGILEPTSKKPSRISYTTGKDGAKVRVFQKTGKEIK
jgi:ribosomal protein L24